MEISAVILAGGKSSRMDRDKALMRFGGNDTMSGYLYNKLSKIFDKVYISSKENKFDFLSSKENLILDNSDIFSPMVSLDTIFETLKQEKIFIIPVDTPLVEKETILELIEISERSDHGIIIAKDKNGKRHNLCGVFKSSIKPQIKKCLDNGIHKIEYLIKNCSHKEILFDDSRQFININKKEQYNIAKNILKEQK